MDEQYDLRGSVHTLEQRRHPPALSSLKDRTDHESFDVMFSPSGQLLQETQYDYSGKVRRIDRLSYDRAGRLIRSVAADEFGLELGATEFEYSEGERACITLDARGAVTARIIEEYDGQLLKVLNSYDGGGRVKLSRAFEYAGAKPSNRTSKFYGHDGNLTEIWISRFDRTGRLAETFGLKPDGSPLGDGRYVYQYDDRGRKSRVLSYNDFDPDAPNHVSRFEYSYDEHGNWIERIEYSRFKSDTGWRKEVTARKLTYFHRKE